jgi:hypothetical protein
MFCTTKRMLRTVNLNLEHALWKTNELKDNHQRWLLQLERKLDAIMNHLNIKLEEQPAKLAVITRQLG